MLKQTELETSRLILRQWHSADYAPFSRMNADPRVMQYFPELMSREMSDAMAERLTELIDERGWGLWALEEKASGDFIGFTGLHIPVADLPFAPCVEVGWRLAREYWGNGYATEAAKRALRVGFDELNLQEIVSFTTVNNLRSRAVMLRIGMSEQDETFEHPSVPESHPLRTHCLYKISHPDWIRNQVE